VTNEKDIFMEVWRETSSQSLVSTTKVTDKVAKIYNDPVFGGIKWNRDETKICFVGEVPDPAAFKNPFETDKKKSEEEKKEENKESENEKEKEEKWQDDKFLHTREFGEQLVGKKSAGLFVFDLKETKLERVLGLPDHLYPQCPVFDQSGSGLVFSGVKMPHFKFGLIFCLNRPTALYYIQSPVFDKKELPKEDDTQYVKQINPEGEYLAF